MLTGIGVLGFRVKRFELSSVLMAVELPEQASLMDGGRLWPAMPPRDDLLGIQRE
jgi:hypothetical protein